MPTKSRRASGIESAIASRIENSATKPTVSLNLERAKNAANFQSFNLGCSALREREFAGAATMCGGKMIAWKSDQARSFAPEGGRAPSAMSTGARPCYLKIKFKNSAGMKSEKLSPASLDHDNRITKGAVIVDGSSDMRKLSVAELRTSHWVPQRINER